MVETLSGAESANFEVFPHDVTSDLRLMDEKAIINKFSDKKRSESRKIKFYPFSPEVPKDCGRLENPFGSRGQ
jgi:hypothetical protein